MEDKPKKPENPAFYHNTGWCGGPAGYTRHMKNPAFTRGFFRLVLSAITGCYKDKKNILSFLSEDRKKRILFLLRKLIVSLFPLKVT